MNEEFKRWLAEVAALAAVEGVARAMRGMRDGPFEPGQREGWRDAVSPVPSEYDPDVDPYYWNLKEDECLH